MCRYSAAIPADQLHINSSLLRGRQHHPDGDEQMLAMAQRYFDVETDSYTRSEKFTSSIYLYQLTQALCMKAETEHYRQESADKNGFSFSDQFSAGDFVQTLLLLRWERSIGS